VFLVGQTFCVDSLFFERCSKAVGVQPYFKRGIRKIYSQNKAGLSAPLGCLFFRQCGESMRLFQAMTQGS
jgi:hypothetical protein